MLKIEEEVGALQQELAEKDAELDAKKDEYEERLRRAPLRRDEIRERFYQVWVLVLAGEPGKAEELEQLRQELKAIAQLLDESSFIDVSKAFQYARNVCWRPLRKAIREKENALRCYLGAKRKLENLAPHDKWDDAELIEAAEACGFDAVAEVTELIERRKAA